MFTQEFSLIVWLLVRPENEPKKIGQGRYFWVFRTDQQKKFALVRPPLILSPVDRYTKKNFFAAFRKMPWVCFKSIAWYNVMFFQERYSRGGKKDPWVSRSNQTWKLHLYLNNKRLVHSRIINASVILCVRVTSSNSQIQN